MASHPSLQQQQQRERDRQQYETMVNRANPYYGSNYPLADSQPTLGNENQTSPIAFSWPPNAQHLSAGDDVFGGMTFSPDNYYNANQADAEIDAILHNYQPKMYGNQSDMMMGPSASSQQIVHNNSQAGSSNNSGLSDSNPDRLEAATAASAAYGHLAYGGVGGVGEVASAARGSAMANWNGVPNQSSNGSSVNSVGPNFKKTLRAKGLNSGGYDGDASNTSSAQTPGGISSGDDSTNGKRRRMTVVGSVAMGAAQQQQDRYEAGLSTGGHDGQGASSAKVIAGRALMQHHNSSYVDSKDLERLAQESLQQASNENARALHASHVQAFRPPYHHRRAHSGSQLPKGESSASTITLKNTEHAMMKGMGQSSTAFVPPSTFAAPQRYTSTTSSASSYAGHAASHPPWLGNHALRGEAGVQSGMNAATDFTKRKGWPTRIVEELLDFVHVLDRQGKVLFASPSILTLTGWRADELKGKELSDFIHPDDVPAVKKEFQRTLHERSEMTMYYRFRRKPQTAADKQRVRDQRDAQIGSRSPSESMSGGDSSSNQDAISSTHKSTFAGNSVDNFLAGMRNTQVDEEAVLRDDSFDKYVVFEATGHPYVSPEGSFPESELKEEHIEKLLPEVIAGSLSTASPAGANAVTSEIQCFFCSCRVFPTKNVGMLDSFLELKLENERLRMMLNELSVNDQSASGSGVLGDGASDGRRSLDEGQVGYHLDFMHDMEQNNFNTYRNSVTSIANPSELTTSNDVLRRGSVVSTNAGGTRSIPTSPNMTLSLERSSVGGPAKSASAVGDESDDETSANTSALEEKRKKKKTKPEEGDYVCTDCGRVDSPEWRKGPLGPKTLCNACGLRWAKKVKRNGGDPNAIAMAARPANGQIQAQAAAARAQKQNLQFQKDNGVLVQTGPTPLQPTGSVQGPAYASEPSQKLDLSDVNASIQGTYGNSAMNQMASQHDFFPSAMGYGPSMQQQQQQQQQHHQQQQGRSDYGPMK